MYKLVNCSRQALPVMVKENGVLVYKDIPSIGSITVEELTNQIKSLEMRNMIKVREIPK